MDAPLEIIELGRGVTPPYACSYLPGETASLDFRFVHSISQRSYGELLRRGWRRFGHDFFRPVCQHCSECLGIRLLPQELQMSKSQRKCWRRNAGLAVDVQPPTVSQAHVDLHNAYHAAMHDAKGWPFHPIDERDYAEYFTSCVGDYAREFLYHDKGRLIGVGLVDIVDDAISSVYFFHAPELRALGLGTFSVLYEATYARSLGLSYHYLGYWIKQCGSISYKNKFSPHEYLRTFPDDNEEPVWEGADSLGSLGRD